MSFSIPALTLDLTSAEPLAEQLRRQLTWQIASGQVKPGELLPPVRLLAGQLGINLHTVRSAFRRLEQDGLVQIRQGARTRVLPFDPPRLVELAGRSRSYTIGVILPGMGNPFYHTFLQGVEEGMPRQQLSLFICDAHEQPQEYERHFAGLLARGVDGIIVASFDLLEYLGLAPSPTLPLVTVDWPGCRGPVVNFDLEGAGYQAVSHLLGHGHRRIGLVTFQDDGAANVRAIEAGYTRALQELGLAWQESLVARMPAYDMASGEQGAAGLMRCPAPPSAIFTIADTLALGALRALREGGWRVPQDVALASLNDIPFADLVVPPLTTAALPARTLGGRAIRMLLELMDGNPLAESAVTLPASLVIRQSCGCGL